MPDVIVLGAGDRPTMSPAWYAVHTKPRCEEQVMQRLRDHRGLSLFLPKLEMLRKRRSQRMTVVEPLFPSYVFVHMCLDPDPWYAVKWTPGVKRIIGVGDTPTPVPFEAMQLLLNRCSGGDVIHWRSGLQEGDTVRVVSGPFAGLEGILDRPTSRGERVRVLLHLLGSTTAVEMDVTDVEHVA